MVILSRIYTKTGDHGDTALGNQQRVAKDHPRVIAYGEVDELNAVLGLLVCYCPEFSAIAELNRIQNELFDLGADLCVPIQETETPEAHLRITANQYEHLEQSIDRWNADLAALTSFILPGGSAAASWLHLARTVCRRAERAIVTLSHTEELNPHSLIYLNRLSDYLFVLGRVANQQASHGDVLWVPGKSR